MSTLHPNTVLFARGTLARLGLWPALRVAVHASWGGPASAEKQRWLAGVLVDQFEPFLIHTAPAASPSALPDVPYIEDLLLQIMSDEFDVDLEDDSAAAVARDLVRLFGDVRAGDAAFVRELEAQAERVKGKIPTYQTDGSEDEDESSSEGEWEDEEELGEELVPQLLDATEARAREEPHVDEDGFTLVKKKGR